MSEAYLVYNPAAGRFPSKMLTERAADILEAQGWQIQLETTHGGPHITELAKQAVAQAMDAFLVAGGDGSVNFAVNGLVGSKTALGVLPAGTANVWAKEIGLPVLTWTRLNALEESAALLANADIQLADVGLCDQRSFLLWSGVGLDAYIVHHIEPRSRWEKHFSVAQYATSALIQASTFGGGIDLNIEANDESFSGHYLLAVVSNIHRYAGGLAKISPSACIDDGEMDLWVFSGDTWLEAITHAYELWSGRHLESDQARCVPFQTLKLSSDSPLYVQVDGEPEEARHEVSISIQPRALRVLVPAGASKSLFSVDGL
jgi:diacylglycerol kinase (ATP)